MFRFLTNVIAILLLIATVGGFVWECTHMPKEVDAPTACQDMFKEYCLSATDCGDMVVSDLCSQAFVDKNFCSDTIPMSVSQMQKCTKDIKNYNCEDKIPQSCMER